MLHMLQIYNKYFYDSQSIQIDSNDLKITKPVLFNQIAACTKYQNTSLTEIRIGDEMCLLID